MYTEGRWGHSSAILLLCSLGMDFPLNLELGTQDLMLVQEALLHSPVFFLSAFSFLPPSNMYQHLSCSMSYAMLAMHLFTVPAEVYSFPH